MANMIFEEVTTYRASIHTGMGWGTVKEASMLLLTADSNIYISFLEDGVQLPENRSPIIQGRQHVYLYMHYNDYPNMIDLLRNEKPINFFYRDDAKFGYFSTSMEPIGENESEELLV